MLGIAICLIAEMVNIYQLIIDLITNRHDMTLEIIVIVVFFPFLILCCFALNRYGYKIYYNSNTKELIRKGFLCGYLYRVKVADIQDIVIITFPKEGTYYVFVDHFHTKIDGGFKKSFIRIEKSPKSEKFIKQFWNKPIKDCHDKNDFLNHTC